MRALVQSSAILPHFSLLLLPLEYFAIQPPDRHFWPRPSNALPHLPNEPDGESHQRLTPSPHIPTDLISNIIRRDIRGGPESTRQHGEAEHNLLVFLRPLGRVDCRHRPRKQPAFHIPINCVRPECSLLEGKVGGDVFPSVVDACRESLSSAPLLPPPPPSPGIHSPRAPDAAKAIGSRWRRRIFLSLSPLI